MFYTDGLVERRGELIDAGIARLAGAVEAGPAEVVCDHVMSSIAEEHPTDDVALLVVRRLPASVEAVAHARACGCVSTGERSGPAGSSCAGVA